MPELNLKAKHSLTLFEGFGSLAVVKLAGHNSPWAKCYEHASIMQSCDCLAVDLQNIIGWTQDKLMSMSQLGKCISSMSTCFLCRMLFRESDFATRLQLLLFQLHHLAQRLSLLRFWEASAPWPWMAASATSFFIRQFSMTAFSIFFWARNILGPKHPMNSLCKVSACFWTSEIRHILIGHKFKMQKKTKGDDSAALQSVPQRAECSIALRQMRTSSMSRNGRI